jgi:hypothetical protein
MIVVSIDLTKIDKSKIVAGKNGQKYYSLVVDELRTPDKYDNTHTVYQNQTKDERAAKTAKVYIGNGKEFKFNQQTAPQQQVAPQQAPQTNPNHSQQAIDDLPF